MPDGLTIAPGATFYPNLEWTVSGLVGTLGVRITRDSDGATVLARATAGITEFGSSGEYTATLVAPTTAGEYTIRWDDGATTVGHVASEGLTVTYSAAGVSTPSGADLCTVSDVRSYLQKATSETAQDTVIQAFITAASQMISDYCQRDLYPITSATYRFQVDGNRVELDHDLRTVTTMTLDPDGAATVLTTSSYSLQPIGADIQGCYSTVRLSNTLNLVSSRAVLFGYNELSILGAWGPAVIEPAVAHAAKITAGLWIRREVAARGILASDLEVDSLDLQPRSIPGAALRALEPYRKLVVA